MPSKPAGTEPGQRHLNGEQTTGRAYRNLSAPTAEVKRANDVTIPMRDGRRLRADLYRPSRGDRHPALVSFSCYPRQIQDLGAPIGFIEAGATDFFVPRGYAQLISNAAGTGGSEGTWNLADRQEREDLYDLIEWVAAQAWCDGNVGMMGISYFAIAQLEAAVERPPHLKAIFPVAVTENLYDIVRHNGLLNSGFISTWLPAVGVMAHQSNQLWHSTRVDVVRDALSIPLIHEKMQHVNGEAIVSLLKPLIHAHYDEEPFGRLLQSATVDHPTYDAFWEERDLTAGLADVQIPVYLGCDWDNAPVHLPGTFTTWNALTHNPNVRMGMLNPGGLTWPWESLHYEALAWYDHWLKGHDTGILEGPPIRYQLPGADTWRTADRWPPAGSALVGYALRANGELEPEEGPAGTRSYLYVPAEARRPANATPPDLADRLDWQTPVMSTALDFVGDIELELGATITALDTAWITVRYDVAPDGTAEAITGSWLRATLRQVNETKSRPGAPVLECDSPAAIPVGETVRYRIPLVPNARRINVEHRLRLVLTSADEARHAPTVLGFRHTPITEASRNTVSTSSRLWSPVFSHPTTH